VNLRVIWFFRLAANLHLCICDGWRVGAGDAAPYKGKELGMRSSGERLGLRGFAETNGSNHGHPSYQPCFEGHNFRLDPRVEV